MAFTDGYHPKTEIQEPKQLKRLHSEPFLERLKLSLPNTLSILLMTITSIPLLFLYLWIVLISFSDGLVGGIIPTSFTLEHWSFLWSELEINGYVYPNIWKVFGSTLAIAIGSSFLEVTISLMAGYVLSKRSFKGKTVLLQSTLLTHAFPTITGLIAAFYILNAVGLMNTLTGIILLKGFAGVGMSTWIIKGFFDDVPKQLEWAADLDGSSRFQTFVKVYVPNVWPGIVAISLFAFLSGWGEYVMVSVFLFDDEITTLSMILKSLFSEEFTGSYSTIMALATFYMFPCLVLYFFSQKALMKMKM
jgi:inositol-phosphate transport system permease protein